MPRVGELLLGVEIGEAGPVALVVQLVMQALLFRQHRQAGGGLGDHGGDLAGLGALFADLLVQARHLGRLLVDLGAQGRAGLLDIVRLGPGRLDQRAGRSAGLGGAFEGGEPRHVQLGLGQVARQAVAVGAGGGGIQFDQHLAGAHVVAVLDADGADHARIQGLDDLDLAGGQQPPGAVARTSTLPKKAHSAAMTKKTPMIEGQGAPGRGGRRLQDLQGGGQELALVAAVEPLDASSKHAGKGAGDAAEVHGMMSPDCRRHSSA